MSNHSLTGHAGLSLTLFVLWILLTGSAAPDELVLGAVVAVVVSIATPRIELFQGFILSPYAPIAVVRYLLHFLIALVQANLDMARRVLTPSLPLNPEIVEVETSLESRLGKLLLANSITLTPGTLTVDVIDDRLLVHWVDAGPGADRTQATRVIAAGFQQHIKGFLK